MDCGSKMTGGDANRIYYERLSAGRDDYWRYMAAPRRRAATILHLLSTFPCRTVVDLGCGNGQLLYEIRSRYPETELAGIDLSSSQIEANRLSDGSIEWIAADLRRPVASAEQNRFDLVVASEIIEHLDDPCALLRNAHSIAAPHGRLIVTTQSGPIRETERRVGHLRHFQGDSLAELLHTASWKPVRIWNEGFPFHDLSKWWANRDPEASMERFGESSYGVRERVICALLRAAFLLNSRRRGAQLFALAEKA